MPRRVSLTYPVQSHISICLMVWSVNLCCFCGYILLNISDDNMPVRICRLESRRYPTWPYHGTRFRAEGFPNPREHDCTGSIPHATGWLSWICGRGSETKASCNLTDPCYAFGKVRKVLNYEWRDSETTFGRDSEIAAIALYLASSAAVYTNGQDIAIDGGISLVNP